MKILMNLPQEVYLHKGHLIQNGVPTSEHGTIQLTNTFAPGQVRITTGLEEVEEGGEVEVGREVAVAPLMHSSHLMKILGHNLTNKREKGG